MHVLLECALLELHGGILPEQRAAAHRAVAVQRALHRVYARARGVHRAAVKLRLIRDERSVGEQCVGTGAGQGYGAPAFAGAVALKVRPWVKRVQ